MNTEHNTPPQPHEEGSDEACAVLLALHACGTLTRRQLAARLGVDTRAIEPVLDGLQQRRRIAPAPELNDAWVLGGASGR